MANRAGSPDRAMLIRKMRSHNGRTEPRTTASGIADAEGSIYAADVAAHKLRKYVKVK